MFSQDKTAIVIRKGGCLPPALRASPEDIFGKMKDWLKRVKVLK